MIRAQEIAWAAGLFEGEGSAGVYKKKGHTAAPVAQLRMRDEDAVRRFARIVGRGSVSFHHDRRPRHSDMWCWMAVSSDALEVLDLLYPYLCERRRAKVEEIRAHVLATPWICRRWSQPELDLFAKELVGA